jgi:hypothetical protein
MSTGSYLSTYLVGRQSDRRYQVTVNNPNGNAERVADFATLEQAKDWVRNQVLAANQRLKRPSAPTTIRNCGASSTKSAQPRGWTG